MKRLKIANELNSQNLTPRHGLFPSTSVKNEILFGTQGPRAFSTQAKKEIKNAFVYAIIPPPASELLSSLESHGLPSKNISRPALLEGKRCARKALGVRRSGLSPQKRRWAQCPGGVGPVID